MIARAAPGPKTGRVCPPCSKSQAHRLLICAALSSRASEIECDGVSRDILATAECLAALGAGIRPLDNGGFRVEPIRSVPAGTALLPCGESGSTLRFLLPVVGVLGARAVFRREGRLPERPLAPLDGELSRHGMELRSEGADLLCSGTLRAGAYTLPGDVSSQYISGLLMALPRAEGDSTLAVTGKIESAAYITMTENALALSGLRPEKTPGGYRIAGGRAGTLPGRLRVEGDWSGAAFFLCIGALSRTGVTVEGMDLSSAQGDRAVLDILSAMGARIDREGTCVTVRRGELRGTVIDAAPVPDLIPTLAAVAAAAEGETRIINAARLRLKESDRLSATAELLRALGGEAEELPDGLIIRGGKPLRGGAADARGDHRIAMAAAVAACAADGEVTVGGGECVAKSYPAFWEDYAALKGETT